MSGWDGQPLVIYSHHIEEHDDSIRPFQHYFSSYDVQMIKPDAFEPRFNHGNVYFGTFYVA